MNWMSAGLIAAAVFLAIRPDPGHRLELIVGDVRGAPARGSLPASLLRIAARKQKANEARKRAIEALATLAADLSAGMPQQQALISSGEGVWPAASGAVRFDGDIAAALRQDAVRMPLLAPLAACWSVSEQQGGGLAISVARMAEQARIAEDIRVQLSAQLAGPRATARILMLLPAFGIAMGMLMGVNPLGWLLGTLPGIACLLAGIALAGLGYWWTSRIVSRVEMLL